MAERELTEVRDLVRDALERAAPTHRRWRALEALYRTGSLRSARLVEEGKLWSDFPLHEEVVNLTLPHINLIISTAVANDPRLLAVPIGGGPEAEDYAATAEGVVNHFWKRTRATRTVRTSTQDAIILGNGFIKLGWSHVAEDEELDDDEFLDATIDALEQDRLQADLAGEEPHEVDEVVEQVDGSVQRVFEDEPWIEYASPYDVFVPPNASEMHDATWVVHRITRPIEEVAELFDVDVEDVLSDTNVNDDGETTPAEWRRRAEHERESGRQLGEVFETATYFEFWDVVNEKLCVLQLDADDFLYQGDLPHTHVRAPFVHIRGYRPNGTTFHGFGDVENVANLQQMMNELFTMQLDNARRSGNKYFIDEEYLDEDVRSALESDIPDQVIPIKLNSQKLMQDVLHVARRHELSNDVYAAKADVEAYLQRVLGINDFQAGGVGADRMSATAAAVVDSIASLRAADKVAAVEQAASEVGQVLLLLCQEWLEEPQAIRIAGNVKPHWIDVSREELQGEFLIEVEAGSTRQENPQVREQRGVQLLREVAPALRELGYDPTPAMRQAIRALGYDPDLLMQPMPQPEEAPAEPGAEPGVGADMSEEELMAMFEDPAFAEGAGGRESVDRGGPIEPLAAQVAGQPLL